MSLLVALVLSALSMPSRATEEPEYQLVRTLADIEVRQYAGYTVAEVVVPGPAGDAGSQAFPVLAGYIFGKNKGARNFDMTAPVAQAADPEGFRLQFVLPKGVTLATAPDPLDARIRIREVPASQVAVIRYSGFWTESNYHEHLVKLQDALRAAGLLWTGDPIYARYNPPFTPWFLRRNEIWLNLASPP